MLEVEEIQSERSITRGQDFDTSAGGSRVAYITATSGIRADLLKVFAPPEGMGGAASTSSAACDRLIL